MIKTRLDLIEFHAPHCVWSNTHAPILAPKITLKVVNMVMAALDHFCLDATGYFWSFLAQSKLDHGLLGLIHVHSTMDGGRNHSCIFIYILFIPSQKDRHK